MTFGRLVEEWAREDWAAENVCEGDDLEDFRCWVAHWMHEARFSPKETTELMETAVMFGRSRVLFTLRGQIDEPTN